LAAYAKAHNHLFGTKIETGVVFMVTRDLQYLEFVFEGEEFEQCIKDWDERVERYYSSKK
jgi:hypothetical protein